jgi:hypothetical protein
MNADIAASDLLCRISVPRGAANTLAGTDDAGAYIRVLIDPMYWLSVSDLPRTFEGYRVVVERRELSQAY